MHKHVYKAETQFSLFYFRIPYKRNEGMGTIATFRPLLPIFPHRCALIGCKNIRTNAKHLLKYIRKKMQNSYETSFVLLPSEFFFFTETGAPQEKAQTGDFGLKKTWRRKKRLGILSSSWKSFHLSLLRTKCVAVQQGMQGETQKIFRTFLFDILVT